MYEQSCVIMHLGEMVVIEIDAHINQCNKRRSEQVHIEGLAQDCSNSSVLAVELLQSCTKPSIYC